MSFRLTGPPRPLLAIRFSDILPFRNDIECSERSLYGIRDELRSAGIDTLELDVWLDVRRKGCPIRIEREMPGYPVVTPGSRLITYRPWTPEEKARRAIRRVSSFDGGSLDPQAGLLKRANGRFYIHFEGGHHRTYNEGPWLVEIRDDLRDEGADTAALDVWLG